MVKQIYRTTLGWIYLIILGLSQPLLVPAQPLFLPGEILEQPLFMPAKQQWHKPFVSDQLNLLVMLSPECPMCRNYTLTLNHLSRQYEGRLHVAGIVPGKAYSDEEILDYKNIFHVSFALYKDTAFVLPRSLGATVTPEVFLVDSQGIVLYSGAIDNWLATLGKKRVKPDKHYLQDALEQVFSGKDITVKHVPAKGCAINDY